MKVYAIMSEHGACSIREQLEMICASREVAESYIEAEDDYWRNAHIEEMEVVCEKYQKLVKKKKKTQK
jgi:hypothetical protein